VCAIGREQVEAAGLSPRCQFIAGDYLHDNLGNEEYDVVLLSNIIHSLGPANNRTLIKKCAGVLRAGGILIVKDFLVDNERTGPAFSLLFALHMLVGTGEGDTYTVAEVEEWAAAAGLKQKDLLALTPQTQVMILNKP